MVGVDGSPSSKMAVRWATREAGMRNVPLSLIHVIDTPPWGSLALGGGAVPLPTETGDWLKTEGAKFISTAVKVAEDSAENGARPQLDTEVYFAATVPALVDLSKGANDCGGLPGARDAAPPSARIGQHRADPPRALSGGGDPRRSTQCAGTLATAGVVGIDGSPASELATAIAFDEASWRGVELIALHAWCDADVSDIPSIEWSAQQAVGEEALAERLAGWRERYPDVPVNPRIVFDRPARHLLDAAESSQLVVVGSHGRGGFSGMLLGSVGTAVAQAAGVPVIVARQR